MRAAHTTLALAIVVGSTIPMAAEPFWQKPKSTYQAQHQAGPSNSLVATPPSATPNTPPKTHLLGPGPHNGDWLRKYGSLSPEEQEKQLERDPVFQSLAPERQKRLIDRLNIFNSFSPAKKQQVLSRMEWYEHLSPAQQQQADQVFHQYRSLPADQQGQVTKAYKSLRKMNSDQRAQYFNSDEFQNNFNDEQRTVLRGMSDLEPD